MYKLEKQIVNFIARWEGFSPLVYKCPAGIKTFGYGSLLKKYPHVQFPISKYKAKEILTIEMYKYLCAVQYLIRVPLNNNQLTALTSFTYNLGTNALKRSTLRKC